MSKELIKLKWRPNRGFFVLRVKHLCDVLVKIAQFLKQFSGHDKYKKQECKKYKFLGVRQRVHHKLCFFPQYHSLIIVFLSLEFEELVVLVKSVSVVCALGFLIYVQPAQANSSKMTAQEWATVKINGFARRHESVEELANEMTLFFKAKDLDGGGYSSSDYQLKKNLLSARTRSRMIGNWARKDINADGRVTLDELAQYHYPKLNRPISRGGIRVLPSRQQVERGLARLLKTEMRFDANKDGAITLSEIYKRHKLRQKKSLRKLSKSLSLPKSLDINKDKKISLDEYSSVVVKVLYRLDRDGDGELNRQERKSLSLEAIKIRRKHSRKKFRFNFRNKRQRKKFDYKL